MNARAGGVDGAPLEGGSSESVVVRDPLWNTIRLGPAAVRIVDSPAYQRLRYIRQLGLAHLVYPGATHTRFDHALGVYHLIHRALDVLDARGELGDVDSVERELVPLAGLLHDIGHYPFSHALEELDASRIPGDHEAVAGRFLSDPAVRAALDGIAPDARQRIRALIQGRSQSSLQGLVSGSLDLDKIEYLKRDARFCGVPFGEVDVDRLLDSLAVVTDPETGNREIGVREKGVAALESLLFAKYQMFRNVYWHHAVRAATVLYKRIVSDALDGGLVGADELVGKTDDALLYELEANAESPTGADSTRTAERLTEWIRALRTRRLPKRAAEVVAADLDGVTAGDWLTVDSEFKRRVEDRIARDLGLESGHAFLDYPRKDEMFALDILVERRGGAALRLGPGGRLGLIGLPRVADELYQTARVLRLFTFGERRSVPAAALADLAAASRADVQQRLDSTTSLLE